MAPKFYNEIWLEEAKKKPVPRKHYEEYLKWLDRQEADMLQNKREEAEALFQQVGITFSVSGDGDGTERTIPFDIIPRVFPLREWNALQRGVEQRVRALNMFLHDVYHDKDIIRAGLIPADLIINNAQYRPEMVGLDVPHRTYAHIAGIDIVRAGKGEFYVLEDNLRVPSGVSYMLENRKMMMRLFPDLFSKIKVTPIAHYPDLLLETLIESAPDGIDKPTIVVLTPGMFVKDDYVYMRTTQGPQRIDVMYRRLDDDFLDPEVFRKDSVLGVPGLMRAYKAGNLTLCNAIGTGIADDKSVYPYVADMIRFYLGEKPLLNNVPTYMCRNDEDRAYVLAHLKELVVKETHGAGGYTRRTGHVRAIDQKGSGQVYRPAHPGAVYLPDVRRSRYCTASCGLAAVCAVRQDDPYDCGWTDPCSPERRIAGGQFLAGGRHQRYLGDQPARLATRRPGRCGSMRV